MGSAAAGRAHGWRLPSQGAPPAPPMWEGISCCLPALHMIDRVAVPQVWRKLRQELLPGRPRTQRAAGALCSAADFSAYSTGAACCLHACCPAFFSSRRVLHDVQWMPCSDQRCCCCLLLRRCPAPSWLAGWLAGCAGGVSCVLAWPCLQVRVRTSQDRARDQLADLAVLNERLAGRAEGEAAQIRYASALLD